MLQKQGNLGVEMVSTSQLLVGDGTNLVQKNIDKVTNGMISLDPIKKPRLVMYDFGQAATLNRNQADGILEIIEAIVDTDVERSVEAFQKMGVLVDNANLEEVQEKVAENYRTGKVMANRKKLRRKGYTFRDDDINSENRNKEEQDSSTTAPRNDTILSVPGSDAKVMSYFSLPAEYAFVARAISQMDGVGKSLDPEFDFISSAAPYLVEVKGADLYVKEAIIKYCRGLQSKWIQFQEVTIPQWWNDINGAR
jgi:predicted unusual protein kinase regulating ubiquinone biosynthesis (AarF/ABC1/UbiB family)